MTIIGRALRGDLPRALREARGNYDVVARRIYENLNPFSEVELRRLSPARIRQCRIFGELIATAISTGDSSGLIGLVPPVDIKPEKETSLLQKLRMIKCRDCGCLTAQELAVEVVRHGLVGECCKPNYVHSPLMGQWVQPAHCVNYVNREGTHVVSRLWAEAAGGRRHRGRDVYVSLDMWDRYMAEFPLPPGPHPAYGLHNPWNNEAISIGGYHSSISLLRQLPSPEFDNRSPPLLIGMELEVIVDENKRRDEAARKVKQIFNAGDNYALCENDSSIGYGFEIVTAWTGLDTHERILSRMDTPEFKALIKAYGLKSHNTTTCGLHLTLDRADMSKMHLAKMLVFLNHPGNRVLVEKVCRRYAQSYCKVKHDKFVHLTEQLGAGGSDRYEILNTTKPRVLEFRGPRGTLRWQSILAAMEFIRLLWLFTRDAEADKLTTEAFVKYAWKTERSSDTKHLREFLVRRRIEPNKALPPEEIQGRSTAEVAAVSAELSLEI